jgi:hypothetical protein
VILPPDGSPVPRKGWAFQLEPPDWLRGPATIDGEWIVLDRRRGELYVPYSQRDLAFDLAAIAEPTDAVAFVRRYGLLRHGPDASEYREPFAEWEEVALALQGILTSYDRLRRALRGDESARRWLWDRWEPVTGDEFEARADTDDELYAQTSKSIAWHLAEGLSGVEEGVLSGVDWETRPGSRTAGGPLDFRFAVRPRDLVGYAFHQVAMKIVNRAAMTACAECGRMFEIHDARQQYCADRCANRARRRRWVAVKRHTLMD